MSLESANMNKENTEMVAVDSFQSLNEAIKRSTKKIFVKHHLLQTKCLNNIDERARELNNNYYFHNKDGLWHLKTLKALEALEETFNQMIY